MTNNSNPINPNDPYDFLKVQYDSLFDRYNEHNSILWSTPTMLFVGQTLLWTLALDTNVTLIFRVLISLVAVFVSVMAFQLYLRNRKMLIVDARQLYSIENYMIEEQQNAIKISTTVDKRSFMPSKENRSFKKNPLGDSWTQRRKLLIWASNKNSFSTWIVAFILFFVVSLLMFIYNLNCLIPLSTLCK